MSSLSVILCSWNLDFFPFLKICGHFLRKSFTKIGQSMNPVKLPYECPRGQPLFPSSLPVPPSRIAFEHYKRRLHASLALGNFLSVLVILSLLHPQSRIEEQSPWVSWNSSPSSLATVASLWGWCLLYFNCIPKVTKINTQAKKIKKIPPQFCLQTGASHCGKTFY